MFIDEIDAVGTKRYDSNSGGEREIQRTMLELLNQLDGFDSRGDVKVTVKFIFVVSVEKFGKTSHPSGIFGIKRSKRGRTGKVMVFPLRWCSFELFSSLQGRVSNGNFHREDRPGYPFARKNEIRVVFLC